MIQELLRSTKLKDVMVSPVITVRESEGLHVVQEIFETKEIRHLPVVNGPGCVVGVISQRQLFKIQSPRRLEDGSWYYDKDMLERIIIKNVRLEDPIVLKADNSLLEAINTMIQRQIGCIPVVDPYRLPLGIITRNDILKFFLHHA